MHDQCTLDDVCRALSFLDPECDRDTWARLAMAIKSEFGDSGFDVWNTWSQGAEKFNRNSARATWKSVKGAGRIGIGTLFALAMERGFTFEHRELTPEEKQAWAREKAERERRRKLDAEREEAETQAWYERISLLSQELWGELKPMGSSPYLGRKKVKAYGLRFFSGPLLLVAHEDHIEQITDWARIKPILDTPKDERLPIQFFKRGCAAIPMVDMDGRIWNLQVLASESKQFLRHGRQRDLLYWIGEPDSSKPLILVEGYATGASIREATEIGEKFDCPVVQCFTKDNLLSVALKLRERYPDQHMVFAADDDSHQADNGGVLKAEAAARAVGGAVWIPSLNDEAEEAA